MNDREEEEDAGYSLEDAREEEEDDGYSLEDTKEEEEEDRYSLEDAREEEEDAGYSLENAREEEKDDRYWRTLGKKRKTMDTHWRTPCWRQGTQPHVTLGRLGRVGPPCLGPRGAGLKSAVHVGSWRRSVKGWFPPAPRPEMPALASPPHVTSAPPGDDMWSGT